MFAKSVIALAAVAGLTAAAPIEQRGAPAGWAYGYLEDYDTYHVRYLALKCYTKHDTQFFQDCCRPMLSTENLKDNRKSYCAPSQEATDFVVSSLSAKAAGYSATPTSASAAAASASEDCEDDDAPSSWSASAAATTSAAPAAKQSEAAPSSAAASSSTTSPAAEKYIAPAPSSSTTTTQAWTPAPTTQAPATTQAPQNNNNNNGGGQKFTGGYATYFYQGGNAGACGQVHGDGDMIAAIDHEQWGDQSFGSGSNTCGRWLTVCNTNNGKCVSVMVADVCPTCANGNSLDLSSGAFNAIANQQDGMVPISWSWN